MNGTPCLGKSLSAAGCMERERKRERERERENVCVCHRRGKVIEIPSNCYKQVWDSSPVTPFTNVYN